jgi:hypothetical protein
MPATLAKLGGSGIRVDVGPCAFLPTEPADGAYRWIPFFTRSRFKHDGHPGGDCASECLKAHAWKAIWPKITERYRNTSLRNRFNDLPAQDAP